MTEKKGLLENLKDVAKSSAEELVERAKAVAHDVASHVGDEAGNVKDRAEATAARARADAHKQDYEGKMVDVNKQVDVHLNEAKAKASEYAEKAKVEAGKLADQAKETAKDVQKDIQDATKKP